MDMQTRAEVKGLTSPDLPDAKSVPDDPADCCVHMQVDIGPVGEDSADMFDFQACAPRGLASQFDSTGRPYWGRATLMIESFSWEAVEAALDQLVGSVAGEDWADVAERLNRFLRWEFEDYLPYQSK